MSGGAARQGGVAGQPAQRGASRGRASGGLAAGRAVARARGRAAGVVPTNAIGMRPRRSKSSSGVVLAWRRAALVIDDYRSAYRQDSTTDADRTDTDRAGGPKLASASRVGNQGGRRRTLASQPGHVSRRLTRVRRGRRLTAYWPPTVRCDEQSCVSQVPGRGTGALRLDRRSRRWLLRPLGALASPLLSP